MPRDLKDPRGPGAKKAPREAREQPDPKVKQVHRDPREQLDRRRNRRAGKHGSDRTHGRYWVYGTGWPGSSSTYAEFYALMPPDNAATVGAGIPDRISSIRPERRRDHRRRNTTEFVLPTVGTYPV